MKLIDLSIEMFDDMPAHRMQLRPVILPHRLHEQTARTLTEGFSYSTNFIAMLDHCGTHVDAFIHINPEGLGIDKMPLELFYGPAVCWDLTHIPPKGLIDAKELEEAKRKSPAPFKEGDIVLLNTGHHKRTWPDKSRWEHEYPGLTFAAIEWFYNHKVRLHGVEGPSTDHPDTTSFPAHQACRKYSTTHYENLCNLEEVVNRRFTFIGFPLRFVNGTGSPVRAVALMEG